MRPTPSSSERSNWASTSSTPPRSMGPGARKRSWGGRSPGAVPLSPPSSSRSFPSRVESSEAPGQAGDRLGIEQIDLYQMHWPNPAFPVRLGMEGMRRVQAAGLTRHVGVSNYSLAPVETCRTGVGDFDSLQPGAVQSRSAETATEPHPLRSCSTIGSSSPTVRSRKGFCRGSTTPPTRSRGSVAGTRSTRWPPRPTWLERLR